MRRPLFWVALLIVFIAAVRLKAGGIKDGEPDEALLVNLEACTRLTVTGQIYKKDNQSIYLRDVSVLPDISDGITPNEISQAGLSRQNISFEHNLICKVKEAEGISLGSYVALRGSFASFQPATNPGEFDAASYYRINGVGGRLNNAEVLYVGGKGWPVRELLYDLRLHLEERLYQALPEDQAGVMCALLLGEKGNLPERVEELYRENGILHILSISSLHITILGMSIYRLLRRLRSPALPAALTGSVVLLLYGGLTGFGLSACRAIGMYLIRMLGEVIGRTYDMLTALGAVGAVMVLRNPLYLYHSGFLLSYSSVLGIGILCPALTRKRKKSALPPSARELVRERLNGSFAASLSVVLATLPVQLWFYYEVPVYAVFLNLLVLPMVKPLMLLGFILLLIPFFSPAGLCAGVILQFYEFLCECFERLPFHVWNPGCPKLWQIVVYYLLLAAVVGAKNRLMQKGIKGSIVSPSSEKPMEGFHRLCEAFPKLCGAFPWMIIVCAVAVLGVRLSPENQVIFLDVGQGDCTLVRTASGENYLFDCGSASRGRIGEYVLVPYLKYYGIHRLDAIFVSHPDEDHISGILDLFETGEKAGVQVCQLVLPGIADELREEQLGRIILAAETAVQNSPVEIRYLAAGDSWQVGSAGFLCLHPEPGSTLEDANAYSQCVYVQFRESGKKSGHQQSVFSMLLTGDVEGEGEKNLLKELKNRGIQSIDVLKVAHHGSRGTTSKELLAQINPVLSVISCGRNNSYGHPHAELLKRLEDCGCHIFQTQESGAVTVRVKDGKMNVESYISNRQ